MKTASIKSTFWKDTWVQKLTPNEKLIMLHLLSTEQINVAGIYDITINTISHETGLNQEKVKKALDRFEKDNKVFFRNDFIILANRISSNYNADNPGINGGVIKVLENLPEEILIFAGDTDTRIGHLIKKVGHLLEKTGDVPILSYLNLIQSKSNQSNPKPEILAKKIDDEWDDSFLMIWRDINDEYKISKTGMQKLSNIANTKPGRQMIADIYKSIELKDNIKNKGNYMMKSINANSMPFNIPKLKKV